MPEIALKHAGRCRSCGVHLQIGTTAHWEPKAGVTCAPCRTAGPPLSPTAQRRSPYVQPSLIPPSPPARLNGPLSPWQQLIEVHLRAVVRESVPTPVPLANRGSWSLMETTAERLVTGEEDTIALDDGALALFTSRPPGENVYYGWPVVVVTDRRGARHAAPVVMTSVVRADESARCAFAQDDAPYLNPGLFTEDFFAPEDLLVLEPLLVEPLPFGDHLAVAARVRDLLGVVAITGAVDPSALSPRTPLEPGLNNVAMVFTGPSDLATKALVAELTELRERTDWTRTAAATLVTGFAATDTHDTTALTAGLPPLSVANLRLNGSQEQALANASSGAVTVVTGPPGTGKSQLVAGIVANQWLAGRSVLVASTNNTAVDVAAERAASIDAALLIRTGNSAYRTALIENLEHLEHRQPVAGMSPEIIRRGLEAAAAARRDVADRFVWRAQAESELAQALRDLHGLRTLLWGSAEHEVDPNVRLQIHALAAKRSRWSRRRRERRLLALAAPSASGVDVTDILRWASLDAHVTDLTESLTDLGPADPYADRSALAAADGAWGRAGDDALAATLNVAVAAARPYVLRLRQVRPQAGAGALRKAITSAAPYLKGWACTTLAAKGNFDLEPALFDLLVVDEASQCSIAHILPLAYRARRIVMVGDPNQLSPIISLDRSHVEQIAAACGTSEPALRQSHLSALADSAFSAYAARVPEVHLLDEHYRCHPQIAAFINDTFYGGALRVLTDITIDPRHPRGLSFVDVPGRTERPGGNGAQRSGAVNAAEVQAIVAWVLTHPLGDARLGIVTPFAAQVAALRHALTRALGEAAFAAADITIGTAHAFQGGECDVVLFSLVLAADAPPRTAAWVENQRNLINVAVSRAKRGLVVFGDANGLARLPVPTLHALVAAATAPDRGLRVPTQAEVAETSALHSDAERHLYRALCSAGHQVRLKPVVEGYELDFTVEAIGGVVNIEVDGEHHLDDRGRQRRQDLLRDAILTRLGIRVVRVPSWRCLADVDALVRELLP